MLVIQGERLFRRSRSEELIAALTTDYRLLVGGGGIEPPRPDGTGFTVQLASTYELPAHVR